MLFHFVLVAVTISFSVQHVSMAKIKRSTDEDVPEECRNLNYCTIKPRDYPQKQFDDLTRTKEFRDKFGWNSAWPVTEENRRKRDVTELKSDNCTTLAMSATIDKVRSMHNGEWRTMIESVNHGEIRLETCSNENSECTTGDAGSKTFCKQLYTVYEFMVLGVNGPDAVSTELPAGCACQYKADISD